MNRLRTTPAEGPGTDGTNDARGLCLAELVIGMAMAILILGGLFEVLYLGHTTIGKKHRNMAQQEELRLGLEVFEQEMRLATPESIISTGEQAVEFYANLHALRTNSTATVSPGQLVVPVADGSGWGAGKMVVICKLLICETHRLSRTGQRHQLTLVDQLQEEFPAGSSVELINRVTYYTREDGRNGMSLMRMVDGGANMLIGGLETIRFSYRDQKGRLVNVPSQVARVIMETALPDRSKTTRHTVALRS